MANPLVSARYVASDLDKVEQRVIQFFCAGAGGPDHHAFDIAGGVTFILVGVHAQCLLLRHPGLGWVSVKRIETESVLTCPQCGHATLETMPTDACQFFYACARCNAVLRPKPGDCCVFCSYGTRKCPPVQASRPFCCRIE